MVCHQRRKIGRIRAPRYVMPSWDRKEGTRVVVESCCVVKASSLGYVLAEAQHAFGAIEKPPRRSQNDRRIMARQWGQLAAIGRFIQREQDQPEVALIAVACQQWVQCVDVVRRCRNVPALVAA